MKAPTPKRDIGPIEHSKTDVRLRSDPLHKVWWQGRQWAVTEHGIECRDGLYAIEAKRLTEGLRGEHPHSWIEHMGCKTWVDLDDFATALLVAVALHGKLLSKADLEVVARGYGKGVRSKEKDKLHKEMFPGEPGHFEAIDFKELDRRCNLVDAEYRRRSAAGSAPPL